MSANSALAQDAPRTLSHDSTPAFLPPPPSLHPATMPDVYAMEITGDCMHPFYFDGQKLLFSKTERWEIGDPVALFRKPESLKPGETQVLFKQLIAGPTWDYWQGRNRVRYGNVKPMVMVRMLNPARTLFFPADSLLGIHKCIGSMEGTALS